MNHSTLKNRRRSHCTRNLKPNHFGTVTFRKHPVICILLHSPVVVLPESAVVLTQVDRYNKYCIQNPDSYGNICYVQTETS